MRDHEIKNGDQEKVLAVLAYLGILVLVSIFMGKKSKYVRFHSNQGLILLIGEVVWWAVRSFLGVAILSISWRLYFLSNILDMVSILFLVLIGIGIFHAVTGVEKELPLVGGFRLIE